MIIDIHAHYALPAVLPPAFFDGWMENLKTQLPSDTSPAAQQRISDLFRGMLNDPGCDRFVAEMDAAGIDKSVLLMIDFGFAFSQDFGPWLEIMDLHRKVMAKHPGRFIVFAGIDPRRGQGGLDLFERAVREWGVAGLKLYPPCGYSPSDERLFPYYETCRAYGLPVLTHVGPTSARLSFKHTRPEDIDDAAREFPDVSFILAHAGMVWFREASLLAQYRPNVFMDVSGFQAEVQRGELESVLRWHLGRRLWRKLLFGTDWPIHRILGSQSRWVQEFQHGLERSEATTEQIDAIFHQNAISLLGRFIA